MFQAELTDPSTSDPKETPVAITQNHAENEDVATPTTESEPQESHHKSLNGFHHFNNSTTNNSNHVEVFNHTSTRYTENHNNCVENNDPSSNLFMTISTKIVNGSSPTRDTDGMIMNKGETTPAMQAGGNSPQATLSPVSLTSLEPANKRARLSNS